MGNNLRELRNSQKHLLCRADDITGEVETEGTHKTMYLFTVPIGGTITVIRDNVKSVITRTGYRFVVNDYPIAA